jgi:RND family efflux transporter MFP subunit
MKSILFKIIIPLIIIGGGVFLLKTLQGQKKSAEHVEPQERILSVETVTVKSSDLPMSITASGLVRPAKQILLTPEVTGRISWISENLIPGSRFKKGAVIARIDKRDYKLLLEQQQGQVQQAELNLQLEQSRGQIAREEWNMISGENGQQEASGLALRKPHLQEAKQRTSSAQSGLQRARLNLKKTTITVPFDAIVVEKNVDFGQLVGPNSPIATLMGTDELWVDVSVPVEQLGGIRIPGLNAETGSRAKVVQHLGTKPIVRTGEVLRLHGQLDARNRTATILVAVPNPFDMEDSLPLLAGAYVDVKITGDTVSSAFQVPRKALREGAYVWLVRADKLVRAEVSVGWREQEIVVITKGIADGDEVVTSPLSVPLEGMKVKRIAPAKEK